MLTQLLNEESQNVAQVYFFTRGSMLSVPKLLCVVLWSASSTVLLNHWKEAEKLQCTLEFCVLSFTIRGGLMKCLNFICHSSDLLSSHPTCKKRRRSRRRTEDGALCSALLGRASKAVFVSQQRACPPVKPSQWTQRMWVGKERAQPAAAVYGEYKGCFENPPSSSPNWKESLLLLLISPKLLSNSQAFYDAGAFCLSVV